MISLLVCLGFAEKCCSPQTERLHQARPDGQDPRLHHLRVEGRHAKVLRQRKKAEGTDQKFAHSLQENSGTDGIRITDKFGIHVIGKCPVSVIQIL